MDDLDPACWADATTMAIEVPMESSVTWLTTRSIDEGRHAIGEVAPDLADRPLVLNDRIVTSDPRYFQGSAVIDDAYIVKFAWSELPARRIVHEGKVLA